MFSQRLSSSTSYSDHPSNNALCRHHRSEASTMQSSPSLATGAETVVSGTPIHFPEGSVLASLSSALGCHHRSEASTTETVVSGTPIQFPAGSVLASSSSGSTTLVPSPSNNSEQTTNKTPQGRVLFVESNEEIGTWVASNPSVLSSFIDPFATPRRHPRSQVTTAFPILGGRVFSSDGFKYVFSYISTVLI